MIDGDYDANEKTISVLFMNYKILRVWALLHRGYLKGISDEQ
jgi:hypothetical protein